MTYTDDIEEQRVIIWRIEHAPLIRMEAALNAEYQRLYVTMRQIEAADQYNTEAWRVQREAIITNCNARYHVNKEN
jgi:hypothetical protein